MEKLLKSLFDYQRFARNEKLSELIEDSESRVFAELDDDDLEQAAGGRQILPNYQARDGIKK